MKKILLIGRSGAGKTTLLQRLQNREITYQKTQSVEVHGNVIDTPGEYIENKRMFRAILVSGYDAEIAMLIQDATDLDTTFFFGMNSILAMPTIGVITKADLAGEKDLARARSFLELAGAEAIVVVSAIADSGINELREWIAYRTHA